MENTKNDGSVLIPKIKPANTTQEVVPENVVSDNASPDMTVPDKSVPDKIPNLAPNTTEIKRKLKVNWKKVGIGVGAFLIFLLVAIGIPAFLTYQKGVALAASAKKLSEAAKTQDLVQIKASLDETKKSLGGFKTSYTLLSWTRIIPYFGGYVAD